jgi:hypothetical protein
MYRRSIGTLLLAAVVPWLAPAPRGSAGDERPPGRAEKLPPDLEFVYQSGGSFVALRPHDLLDTALLKQLPPGMQDRLGKVLKESDKALGLRVSAMERVSVLMPSVMAQPVFVVRTPVPYDRDALRRDIGKGLEEVKEKGRTLYLAPGRDGDSLYPIDDRSYAVGTAAALRQLIARADGEKTARPHGVAVKWAAANHHAVLGTTADPLLAGVFLFHSDSGGPPPSIAVPRREPRLVPIDKGPKERPDEKKEPPPEPAKEGPLGRGVGLRQEEKPDVPPPAKPDGFRAEPDFKAVLADLPPAALPYKPLLQAQSIALALDLGAESKLRWHFTFPDAAAAADGETAVRSALYVWRELLSRLPRELTTSPESARTLLPAIKEMQSGLRTATMERRGVSVEGMMSVKTDEKTVGPFLAEVERAAQRKSSENNLRQIALAMHAAHDTFGALPNAAICDKEGKPLLSWRVHILPFIEQENLYKQFKLDEPWDSPNNIKLLDRMPSTFALTMRPAKRKGETFVRVFTGRDTPFDLTAPRPGPITLGLRLTDFLDGTSNTLMIVEAAEAVPWTKPDDLPYDAKKPIPKLGGAVPGRFFAVFADGSVRSLSTKLDEVVLRALITPKGGEVVSPDWDQGPGRKGPPTPPPDAPPPPPATKPPQPDRKPEP